MIGTFSTFDGLILFGYLIVVLSIGFYSSRKKDKSYLDYFLAGRKMGWVTIGITIFATNISSEHFIGLAGSGSARGLAVGQFELMAIFILIFLGWFLAPIFLKSGVITMPEFLEQRFDRRIRKFFAAFSILIYLLTKILVTLFAGGLLFYNIFGLNIYTSSIIIVLITGLYTVIGGANAVMRTQMIQGLVLIAGASALLFFGLDKVGGFSGLEQKLPGDFFNMFKPVSDPDYPWTGIIFGAPIIAFWYWCTDQYIVQRVLSAKSLNDARRGSLLAAFLKVFPIFVLVVPGLIAVALYPEINGDEAYSFLIAGNILPSGIKGLVIAGLLAAIMSSLSGVFNSTAVLFTNDFYKLKHPEASDRKLVLVGRLASTAIVVAAILTVPLMKMLNSQIYLFLQSVQAFVAPPISAVFLVGMFFKNINAKAAIYTLVIGEFIGLGRLLTELLIKWNVVDNPIFNWVVQINFLHFAIFLFIISAGLIFSLSFIFRKREVMKSNRLQFSLSENFSELMLAFPSFKKVKEIRMNLIMSGVIVLIVVSVWSLWN
ncbi:MAG TPA: sodium:solute symporter [Ignavibacteriaceae bacterium]|nr:sodium:solute symporter [Ignavibacteriaceae bacterium]